MRDYPARKWITKSETLTPLPCELIYAQAVSDGGEIKDTVIYDGENTRGEIILNCQMGTNGNITLSPPEPIKCRHGLYVNFGSSTEGVLMMWREYSDKG